MALLDHCLAEDTRAGARLEKHVDAGAVGVAGHSLGGYTALGLVGGWETWRDKRVQAALLMSPYLTPYLEKERLKGVAAPVMLQGGTLDFGITPFLPRAYRDLRRPKYYLVLEGETHFGWTNLVSLGKTTTEAVEGGNPELIARYSVAFFDRHLKRNKGPILDESNERLATYQQDGK